MRSPSIHLLRRDQRTSSTMMQLSINDSQRFPGRAAGVLFCTGKPLSDAPPVRPSHPTTDRRESPEPWTQDPMDSLSAIESERCAHQSWFNAPPRPPDRIQICYSLNGKREEHIIACFSKRHESSIRMRCRGRNAWRIRSIHACDQQDVVRLRLRLGLGLGSGHLLEQRRHSHVLRHVIERAIPAFELIALRRFRNRHRRRLEQGNHLRFERRTVEPDERHGMRRRDIERLVSVERANLLAVSYTSVVSLTTKVW